MQVVKRFLFLDGNQLRVILDLDKEDLQILTEALDSVIFDSQNKDTKENLMKADFVRLSKYLNLALSKKKNSKAPADSSETEDRAS